MPALRASSCYYTTTGFAPLKSLLLAMSVVEAVLLSFGATEGILTVLVDLVTTRTQPPYGFPSLFPDSLVFPRERAVRYCYI